MVDAKIVQKQLKKLKFGASPWNQAEVRELPRILHEHEKIAELVNGYYEGGVALLVATDSRLLLIDKKPLNYLTVEDLRFDMINEIDYSHRLFGATITISTGSKTLKFKSYNQQRLRNLINMVQERMSLTKKEQSDKADNQQQHLEEINKQLQMYLLAQHQQLQLQVSGEKQKTDAAAALPKPDAQLADYLFAQRLLEQFQKENGPLPSQPTVTPITELPNMRVEQQIAAPAPVGPAITAEDLRAEAQREIFGANATSSPTTPTAPNPPVTAAKPTMPTTPTTKASPKPGLPIMAGIEINPIRIAYSKLPMMLRNRKFGRPSLHAHSQQQTIPTGQVLPTNS